MHRKQATRRQSPTAMAVLAALATLAGTLPMAHAAPISGLGMPSAHAALAGGTVVDFESDAAGAAASSFSYASVTLTGNNILRVTDAFAGTFNVTGQAIALTTNDRTQSLDLVFATTVDAFGLNIGGTDQIWRLEAYAAGGALIEGMDIPILAAANDGQWYGIAAGGIAGARLFNTAFDVSRDSGTLDYIVVDNVTTASVVPEPGTMALALVALFGCRIVRRRSRT